MEGRDENWAKGKLGDENIITLKQKLSQSKTNHLLYHPRKASGPQNVAQERLRASQLNGTSKIQNLN